jgi:hypothetical protein
MESFIFTPRAAAYRDVRDGLKPYRWDVSAVDAAEAGDFVAGHS